MGEMARAMVLDQMVGSHHELYMYVCVAWFSQQACMQVGVAVQALKPFIENHACWCPPPCLPPPGLACHCPPLAESYALEGVDIVIINDLETNNLPPPWKSYKRCFCQTEIVVNALICR